MLVYWHLTNITQSSLCYDDSVWKRPSIIRFYVSETSVFLGFFNKYNLPVGRLLGSAFKSP